MRRWHPWLCDVPAKAGRWHRVLCNPLRPVRARAVDAGVERGRSHPRQLRFGKSADYLQAKEGLVAVCELREEALPEQNVQRNGTSSTIVLELDLLHHAPGPRIALEQVLILRPAAVRLAGVSKVAREPAVVEVGMAVALEPKAELMDPVEEGHHMTRAHLIAPSAR